MSGHPGDRRGGTLSGSRDVRRAAVEEKWPDPSSTALPLPGRFAVSESRQSLTVVAVTLGA
ncbi:hypothetical protein GCM10010932_24840 [Agromyces flavus]|nr:hypothetical protein GCM10010932_24840 [Agromyces flavus]